jgi:Ca-activated chloride channel family protein
MLAQIAQLTGGQYFPAQSVADLHTIYDSIDPRIEFRNQQTELTAILAGFGLVLLLAGALASLAWTGRIP